MKTKIILILVTLSFFACKEKVYYTYEQFRITNNTLLELIVSFDGKEHIIQPSEKCTIDIARQDHEYRDILLQESFFDLLNKLSIFRIINNEKVYLTKEHYYDREKWGLTGRDYGENREKIDREVVYVIRITEDMFILEQD